MVLAALAAAVVNVPAVAAAPAAKNGAAFDDQCQGQPGYAEFRAKLRGVVAARDGTAFRALFHPDGAMRIHGIGGRANTPDWGFGRPDAKAVWQELDEILQLGCYREGKRLVLPGIASLRGSADVDQMVVVRSESIRSGPSPTATMLRRAERGELFTFFDFDTPSGWTSISVGGKTAYLPTAALRSPYAVQLVLVPFDGGWRIREFSTGV